MSSIKHGLLTGAVALAGAAGLAGSASAAIQFNGGGSTLLAPYWAQAAYCADAVNTQYQKPGTVAAPIVANVTTMIPSGNLCGNTVGTTHIGYDAVGSGAGYTGVLTHEALPGTPTSGGNLIIGNSTILFGAKMNSNPVGNELFTSIQYGLSDNPLVDTDVATYSVDAGTVYPYPSGTGNATASSGYGGFPAGNLTFSGNGNHVANSTAYPVPKNRYGALVQFPVSVDPVAMAYAPAGTTAFTYGPGITRLQLDDEAICRIFVGNITNWNDAKLKALNGNTALNGNLPIKLVGRLDSSGTTSILTRHLAAVCTPFTAGNHTIGNVTFSGDPYVKGTTTLPANVQGLFTLVAGSGGVQTELQSTIGAGGLGYVGPDYTVDFAANSGTGSTLLSAMAKNAAGHFQAPTPTSANAAFSSILPPQSDSNGNFVGNASGFRVNPFDWVQSTAATANLANPGGINSYPIVGTTNFVGYTCYADGNVTTLVKALGPQLSNVTLTTILTNVGLAAMPTSWSKAITDTFLSGNIGGAVGNLGLYVATASTTPANAACTTGGNHTIVGA